MEKSKTALMADNSSRNVSRTAFKRWHKCVAVDGEYFEGDHF